MKRTMLAVLSMSLLVMWSSGSFAADAAKPSGEKAKSEAKKDTKKSDSGKPQLVTEGEFATWLVQVLGLARFLPASPSEQECFAILLQNGITPANGWNSTNIVTRGTLARTAVQALGQVAEVKDPSKDESYIEHLRALGIEIGTIGEAVEHLEVLDNPMADAAVVAKTDPLAKVLKIRPVDETQSGTDMVTITRVFSAADLPEPPPPSPPPAPPKPPKPSPRPPPMTPF